MGDLVELRTDPAFVGVEMTRAARCQMAGPARLHDRWTLSMLEEGEELLWRHGALHTVRAGDVAIYAPGEVEVVLRRSGPGSRRADVSFDGVPEGPRGPFAVPTEAPTSSDVAAAVRRITAGSSGTRECEQAITTLGAALRAVPPEPYSHAEPGSVARVRRYLLGHPTARVNLHELAEVAGISEGHLVRIFHAWVGVPPHSYLQHLRVSVARKLLARGLPCGAAAQHAGFADSSHLTRLFRRLLGFTPSEYAEARRVWDQRGPLASRSSPPHAIAV